MGRRILIVCVALMLVAGAAVGFSRLSEPTPTTTIVRGSSDTVLVIEREYDSVEAMQLAAATDEVPEGHYVLINTGNVEDPDHAKVYIKGADGYELVADLSGATGAQGLQGEKGTDGAPGVTPLLMINADSGMWEVSYDAGTTWESLGVQARGPKGDTGATGATGAQGPKGDTGATGATGAQGIQGPKGDTGATGAQGPAGADGKDYVITTEDMNAIIEAVLERLALAESPYYRRDGSGWVKCAEDNGLDEYIAHADCGGIFFQGWEEEIYLSPCPHCGEDHAIYSWSSNPNYH